MSRAKKNSETRCFNINIEVLKQLDIYSEETLMAKSAIVELALRKYFAETKRVPKIYKGSDIIDIIDTK